MLEQSVIIFPVPTSDIVSIKITNELLQDAEIELLKAFGQLLIKEHFVNNTVTIDISNLSSGVYFIKINNDNYFVSKKIVKK